MIEGCSRTARLKMKTGHMRLETACAPSLFFQSPPVRQLASESPPSGPSASGRRFDASAIRRARTGSRDTIDYTRIRGTNDVRATLARRAIDRGYSCHGRTPTPVRRIACQPSRQLPEALQFSFSRSYSLPSGAKGETAGISGIVALAIVLPFALLWRFISLSVSRCC
jgi:hypothetical protein